MNQWSVFLFTSNLNSTVFESVNLLFISKIHSSLVQLIIIWICESLAHVQVSFLSHSAHQCLNQWILSVTFRIHSCLVQLTSIWITESFFISKIHHSVIQLLIVRISKSFCLCPRFMAHWSAHHCLNQWIICSCPRFTPLSFSSLLFEAFAHELFHIPLFVFFQWRRVNTVHLGTFSCQTDSSNESSVVFLSWSMPFQSPGRNRDHVLQEVY